MFTRKTILCVFSLFLPTLSNSQNIQPDQDRFLKFGFAIDALRKELKIPGLSAAIVLNEKVIWAQGFGFADVDKNIKASSETVYHLASVTKPFAAIIILQLVEQGKLNLDDPISKFGIKIKSPGTITVRHLLTHTSEGDPGQIYRYNGNRYLFLGQVIESVTGKTFSECVVSQILAPLHMNSTAPHMVGGKPIADKYAEIYDNLSIPYMYVDGRLAKGSYYPDFNASAGLVSTVLDIAKFDIALSQNNLIRKEAKELAFSPFINSEGTELPYGLGWQTQAFQGIRLIWHNGYYPPSTSALLLKVPDKRITLILLANTDAMSHRFSLASGDAFTSPLAILFYTYFIASSERSLNTVSINWESSIPEITGKLHELKREEDIDLAKRELMAFWRLFKITGREQQCRNLLNAYEAAFTPVLLQENPKAPAIAEIKDVGNNQHRTIKFNLEKDTRIRIFAIGEGDIQGMSDFGGIINSKTKKEVWSMQFKNSTHAGGAMSNRLFNSDIFLPKGPYKLFFKTDASHSYKQWTAFPPDVHFWGISVFEELP